MIEVAARIEAELEVAGELYPEAPKGFSVYTGPELPVGWLGIRDSRLEAFGPADKVLPIVQYWCMRIKEDDGGVLATHSLLWCQLKEFRVRPPSSDEPEPPLLKESLTVWDRIWLACWS